MESATLPWADLTENLDLEVGIQLRGIVEILNAVHAKYQLGRPLVASRAAWVLSLKRGGINRDGEAELHSQPPPPPDAPDDLWRTLVAPEVQMGSRPDERSDIFVLGGMLFEAVTGHPFESPAAAVKELENSRATARAAGLGGDYWEVELLAAAVRATREDPESRWPDAKQLASEIERIAAHRIKSKSALGSVVAGQRSPSLIPDSRKTTLPPPPAKAEEKAGQAEAPAAKAEPKAAEEPMRPAPVPKRSFTPAGLGVVSAPVPEPATGLGPPLPKAAPQKESSPAPSASERPPDESGEIPLVNERKGTMLGLGMELPPPPPGHEEPRAASENTGEIHVSAAERKGTMVGLGFEMPPPPPGHADQHISATGRKGTMAGLGLELPPPPSSAEPVSPNRPGRFATHAGLGPTMPAGPTLEQPPVPTPVGPNQPGRTGTVQGIGPNSSIPIPPPPPIETEADVDIEFALTRAKPKRRWGRALLAAAVLIAAGLLVLRFGFRSHYDDLHAESLRAVGGVEANVKSVQADPEGRDEPAETALEENSAESGAAETSVESAAAPGAGPSDNGEVEVGQAHAAPLGAVSPPGAASPPSDSAEGDSATDETAPSETDKSAAASPAKALRPAKPKRPKRAKKPELKTPDYGI